MTPEQWRALVIGLVERELDAGASPLAALSGAKTVVTMVVEALGWTPPPAAPRPAMESQTGAGRPERSQRSPAADPPRRDREPPVSGRGAGTGGGGRASTGTPNPPIPAATPSGAARDGEIERLYRAGETVGALAGVFGVSSGRISQILTARGVERREPPVVLVPPPQPAGEPDENGEYRLTCERCAVVFYAADASRRRCAGCTGA